MHKILLFYKYIPLTDLEGLREEQINICRKLNLKGRTIIAKEGINSTLGGLTEDIHSYIKYMKDIPEFADIDFKISDGVEDAFPRLSVKIRDEIVSAHLGKNDINPNKTTGKYLTADELHSWFRENKEFYIVDMRNSFEYKIGHFKNSIDSQFRHFRDLPKVVTKLKDLKDKVIVTACTGGVRCGKASGYLLENGFKNVYQLYGGMQTYMQKYPTDDFLGKLYVFDKRVAVAFKDNHVVVGKCELCGQSSENIINCGNPNCNRHFICCENCADKETGKYFCSKKCQSLFINTLVA